MHTSTTSPAQRDASGELILDSAGKSCVATLKHVTSKHTLSCGVTTFLADKQLHRGECQLPSSSQGEPLAGEFSLVVIEVSSGASIDVRAVVIDACPESFQLSDAGDTCTCAPGETLFGAACAPCAAGSAKGREGAMPCDICDAGSFAAVGATTCAPCQAGTFSSAKAGACSSCALGKASGAGASSCDVCAAGTFAVAASGFCASCLPGTFSEAEAGGCSSCAVGETSNASAGFCTKCSSEGQTSNGDNTACVCSPGYFEKAGQCHECETGTKCEEVGTTPFSLRVINGYWRSDAASTKILECAPAESCEEGLPLSVCRDGHLGCVARKCARALARDYAPSVSRPQCSVCEADYTKQVDGLCKQCDGDVNVAWTIILVILGVMMVVSCACFALYGSFTTWVPSCGDAAEQAEVAPTEDNADEHEAAALKTRHKATIFTSFFKLAVRARGTRLCLARARE